MRSLCVLALLAGLLLLAGTGTAWVARSVEGTRNALDPEGTRRGEARLVGRGRPDGSAAPGAGRVGERRHRGEILASIVGPPDRPHAPADRLRLFAERDTGWEDGADRVECMLRDCEDHVVNELSLPCGLLLTGREDGEGPEVDEAPWVDLDHGTFEAAFRAPSVVEALYVYGGRIHARASLTDAGTRLVVDPDAVFARTGGLELCVRRGDTGETVADVVLEIEAVDRAAATHTDTALDGEGYGGVRPVLFSDLPAGAYDVRVERPGPPWTFGVATVQVRAGQVSRETITLGPGASFCMRWFRPDGRPTETRFTTVRLRDRENRLHEIPVRRDDDDPLLMRVDRAPPGRCWLVTPDRRAHAIVADAAAAGPEHVMRLEEWTYVVLAARLETPLPKPLATRAPSHWIVWDDQGVIVEEDDESLIPDNRQDDGTFEGWAHLTPGRYHVRWRLTPDLAVERSFEISPGGEEVRVALEVAGP